MKNKTLNQWLTELENKHNKKIDLGLERVGTVFRNLDLDFSNTKIITVAGTNGKGSTVAITSSIAREHGLTVGEFTSPHILTYNERIKINGINVEDELIIKAFELIESSRKNITLSYFEYSTLAALIIFHWSDLDLIILEVGLGGRLDSTNVIDSDCAVITTISIDHTEWLGNTIEQIGFEKAGIARQDKPLIFGSENCPKSIIKVSKELNCRFLQLGKDFKAIINSNSFNYLSKKEIKKLPFPNIEGEWQINNSCTAMTALSAIGVQLDKQLVKKGLQNILLSGRLQHVATNPEVICDVSHNQEAAISLSSWLKDNPIEGKTIAIFSVLEDKNFIKWAKYFESEIDVWCVSEIDNSRAMPCQEMIKVLANHSKLIMSFEDLNEAFVNAKLISKDNDRIIIFGSFYTVSEVYSKNFT